MQYEQYQQLNCKMGINKQFAKITSLCVGIALLRTVLVHAVHRGGIRLCTWLENWYISDLSCSKIRIGQ